MSLYPKSVAEVENALEEKGFDEAAIVDIDRAIGFDRIQGYIEALHDIRTACTSLELPDDAAVVRFIVRRAESVLFPGTKS